MSTTPVRQPPAIDPAELLGAALLMHQKGDLPSAEKAYRAVLRLSPQHFEALYCLGSLLATQKRYKEAAQQMRAATVIRPGQAQVHVDLAQVLRGLGLNEEAGMHFDHAHALEPANRQYDLLARLQRATLYDEQGNSTQALACFQDAVERHPDSADAWAGLGMVQMHSVGPVPAEQSFRRALQIDPDREVVIEKFGQVLQDLRQYEDAALVFERLMARWPERKLVPGRLLHCKMLMADWFALDRLQQRVETALAAGQLSTEPFGLQGYCASPELLYQAARVFTATLFPDRSGVLPAPRIGRGPKVRVGYVAGEFRNQATSVLLTQVLEMHDRSRFEIHAFDNGWDDGSTLRKRIEAAVSLVPIRDIDNLQAAQAVRERGIDILVNLNGFFGRTRTPLFSLRAAPVQVNYLGFPGTIGAPYIDYIIADPVVIPPEQRRFYAEKVVYLPDSYQPNDAKRPLDDSVTRAEAGLPEHGFVFCCMNNVYKIMPAVFDVWMRLLLRVPGSVLLLLSDVPEAHANLRHEAGERGVDPARIVFGTSWSNKRHLGRLRVCDLFLDTLPYNAHTTGSDALWAGLPVLTCLGQAFPGRVGASLLRAVGLPDLVTESLADYEALALRLATEPGLLATLRKRLSDNLPTCPLYDTPRYTRHLEAAYQRMVEQARAGRRPTGISIDPLP
jgi:protein O-GlcNAc transferase